jgi:hypothetical protein
MIRNLGTKNILMFVILAAGMLTGLTATTMYMAAPAFGDKKKCDDNDNNNCNDTHKTQKIDEKNKCKVENENEDHSSHNLNEVELACVNIGANLNKVLVLRLPSTGTLLVTKSIRCPVGAECADPSDFEITVSGNNPSPSSFKGSATGTEVTLGSGQYTVSESGPTGYITSFLGDCVQDSPTSASGNINAGETQDCDVVNTLD